MMYDIVAHPATTFSRRLCAGISLYSDMDPVTLRLKALRARTQPRISSRKVAEALGMPASTYAAYEDGAKFKKPILPLDLTKKLAEIFEPLGIPRAETLELAGITGELAPARRPEAQPRGENDWLMIEGAVAAGVWREQSNWPPSERYEIEIGRSPYTNAQRFGVRMEGRSMDLTIPPGSDLECLRVIFSPVPPAPGDLVIVQRLNHDLTEMTCKRLDMIGDEWVLRCESSQPEFQEVIHIGKPDPEAFDENDIRVIGIVLSARVDLARPGLSSRRFPRG